MICSHQGGHAFDMCHGEKGAAVQHSRLVHNNNAGSRNRVTAARAGGMEARVETLWAAAGTRQLQRWRAPAGREASGTSEGAGSARGCGQCPRQSRRRAASTSRCTGQRAEGRGQRAEGRGQRTAGRDTGNGVRAAVTSLTRGLPHRAASIAWPACFQMCTANARRSQLRIHCHARFWAGDFSRRDQA
jgi:hypothetical protein